MEKVRVGMSALVVFCMAFYVGWVFYISEPTYIDSCNKAVEKFDLISANMYSYDDDAKALGLVLQKDSTRFIAKMMTYLHSRDEFREFKIKNDNYRIIGSGTFYHKVNCYVGFNIMVVTQLFIIILLFILILTMGPLFKSLIYKE